MTVEEIDRKLEAARAVLLDRVSTMLRAELVALTVPHEPEKIPAQEALDHHKTRIKKIDTDYDAGMRWMFREGARRAIEEIRGMPDLEDDYKWNNWEWTNAGKYIFDTIEKKMTSRGTARQGEEKR